MALPLNQNWFSSIIPRNLVLFLSLFVVLSPFPLLCRVSFLIWMAAVAFQSHFLQPWFRMCPCASSSIKDARWNSPFCTYGSCFHLLLKCQNPHCYKPSPKHHQVCASHHSPETQNFLFSTPFQSPFPPPFPSLPPPYSPSSTLLIFP